MAFKKSIALFTAFLLLVSNAGFAMTVHYCGGRISSISSVYANSESCTIQKAETDKSCCAKKVEASHKKSCSDKTVQLKGKTGDVVAKSFFSEMVFAFIGQSSQTKYFTATPQAETKKIPAYYCDAHAPPLFKLFHQYILYA